VLAAVAQTLRPRLFLFPGGSVGLQLAPALAVRTGAAFAPRAHLETSGSSAGGFHLMVRRLDRAADGLWSADVAAGTNALVATLGAGSGKPEAEGAAEAELQVFSAPEAELPPPVEVAAESDAQAALAVVERLVLAGKDAWAEASAAFGAGLPAGAALLEDAPAAALVNASPGLIVLVGKPPASGMDALALAPDADVVSVGKRAPAPAPLAARLWLWGLDRSRALLALARALRGSGGGSGASEAGS
jgi:hypothetical protein